VATSSYVTKGDIINPDKQKEEGKEISKDIPISSYHTLI
jgi:hypothetical protein